MQRIRRDHNGFTLAELLIVVAIIAVLVSISIPLFNKQLEKSREATDAANIRSKYAEMMADILLEEYKGDAGYTVKGVQAQDDWQNNEFKTNLMLIQDNWPVAKGTASIYFKDKQAHVTWTGAVSGSGSGGDSSGGAPAGGLPDNMEFPSDGKEENNSDHQSGGNAGSSTGTGENSGGSQNDGISSDGEGNSSGGIDGEIEIGVPGSLTNPIVYDHETYFNTNSSFTVETGSVYENNGKLYVGVQDKTFDTGYHPALQDVSWAAVTFSGKNYSVSDLIQSPDASKKVLTNLQQGDVYMDAEGKKYIYKNATNNSTEEVMYWNIPGQTGYELSWESEWVLIR